MNEKFIEKELNEAWDPQELAKQDAEFAWETGHPMDPTEWETDDKQNIMTEYDFTEEQAEVYKNFYWDYYYICMAGDPYNDDDDLDENLTETKATGARGRYQVEVFDEGDWHKLNCWSTIEKATKAGEAAVEAVYQDYRIIDKETNNEVELQEKLHKPTVDTLTDDLRDLANKADAEITRQGIECMIAAKDGYIILIQAADSANMPKVDEIVKKVAEKFDFVPDIEKKEKANGTVHLYRFKKVEKLAMREDYAAKETSYNLAKEIAEKAKVELSLSDYQVETLEHDINNLRANEWVEEFERLPETSEVRELFFENCVEEERDQLKEESGGDISSTKEQINESISTSSMYKLIEDKKPLYNIVLSEIEGLFANVQEVKPFRAYYKIYEDQTYTSNVFFRIRTHSNRIDCKYVETETNMFYDMESFTSLEELALFVTHTLWENGAELDVDSYPIKLKLVVPKRYLEKYNPQFNESVDADPPFTFAEVRDELKRETNNWETKEDTIRYGFQSEKDFAMEILSQHYECEYKGKEGNDYVIHFWKLDIEEHFAVDTHDQLDEEDIKPVEEIEPNKKQSIEEALEEGIFDKKKIGVFNKYSGQGPSIAILDPKKEDEFIKKITGINPQNYEVCEYTEKNGKVVKGKPVDKYNKIMLDREKEAQEFVAKKKEADALKAKEELKKQPHFSIDPKTGAKKYRDLVDEEDAIDAQINEDAADIEKPKYEVGSEKVFAEDSEEHAQLQKAADKLTDLSVKNYKYFVSNTYLDFDSGWQWTTILAKKPNEVEFQVLSPLSWRNILNAQSEEDLDAAIEQLRSDEYFHDKIETPNTNSSERDIFNYLDSIED